MNRHRIARVAGVIVIVPMVAAGCSSSAAKQDGSHADASALAAKLGKSLKALTAAHLDIDAGSLGGKSTADVTLDNGHATATDVKLSESAGQIDVVTVDGKSYAKVPAGASKSGKPWVLVSSDSTNPLVQTISPALSVTGIITSLSVVSGLVDSASDVQDHGSASVDGVPTTHYTMKVDPNKSTGNSELDGMLRSLGGTKIPVDLWLDGQARPVKFVLDIALGSSKFPVTVDVSKLDAPLTITAPPASEVGTG